MTDTPKVTYSEFENLWQLLPLDAQQAIKAKARWEQMTLLAVFNEGWFDAEIEQARSLMRGAVELLP